MGKPDLDQVTSPLFGLFGQIPSSIAAPSSPSQVPSSLSPPSSPSSIKNTSPQSSSP